MDEENKMDESEFFLWLAFIHTAPDDFTATKYGSSITAFYDFSWREYTIAGGYNYSSAYYLTLVKYQSHPFMMTEQIIECINNYKEDE